MSALWRWSRERVRRLGAGRSRAAAAALHAGALDPGTPLTAMSFVAIDTETTGLDPRRDALVALAAVPFHRGEPQPEAGWARLVNPGCPIPAQARAIHGIADADVRGAPPVAAVLPAFLAICAERPIVAHTAPFDLALLNAGSITAWPWTSRSWRIGCSPPGGT
jgi:DNA polymerase III epsilon subunit-like protein